MKMDSLQTLAPQGAPGASPEVFQQLGQITRQLHDALAQLGVMPCLQCAASGLPDVRSRLNYIATKAGEAANRVLNSVDQAKIEHAAIQLETRRAAAAMLADPSRESVASAVAALVNQLQASSARIDGHLTDIMLAQDFHDLTGQVVAKVVTLASDLEDSLVKLLLQVAPGEPALRSESAALGGPVINPQGRTDVVADQGEVDDLLASLGF